jgi:hypothetical protein
LHTITFCDFVTRSHNTHERRSRRHIPFSFFDFPHKWTSKCESFIDALPSDGSIDRAISLSLSPEQKIGTWDMTDLPILDM